MQRLTSSIYSFEDLIKGGFLYIDKTDYIWKLVEPPKESYFLSRPRRFGKSLTLSTLKAVFEGKKELFKGLAIYDKPYNWKTYPIIHLDLNGWNFDGVSELKRSLGGLVREAAEDHGVSLTSGEPDELFRELIRALSQDEQIVILLDEYDKPILNNIGKPQALEIRDYLKSFYSVIKTFENRLRFAFVTGVSKFAHVSLFSDLNNLTDLTMRADFATMLGYTQAELEANFGGRIRDAAQAQHLPEAECKARIRDWNDGYRFAGGAEKVYNPVSIAQFFEHAGAFSNYWFSTGTPTFLLELLRQQSFDLAAALSQPVSGFTFDAYDLTHLDPLTMLVQTGYLTIGETQQKYGDTLYQLRFPNLEVKGSFETYLASAYSGLRLDQVKDSVFRLADFVAAGDVNGFMQTMKVFFAKTPYSLHLKDENNFQTLFFSIFMLLGIAITAESQTCQGRIDAVAEKQNFVFLFEFKLGQNGAIALAQIKERDYFRRYLLAGKRIFLIGANFNAEAGQLADWKAEEVQP